MADENYNFDLKSIGYGQVKQIEKELSPSEAIKLITAVLPSWKEVAVENIKVHNFS